MAKLIHVSSVYSPGHITVIVKSIIISAVDSLAHHHAFTAVMTVQDEKSPKAMPQTASTRSRFMITDILSGGGGPPGSRDGAAAAALLAASGGGAGGGGGGGRSPSPGPRDLSLHASTGTLHHHHHHHHQHHQHPDSDTDSSGHPDTSSVCSNGKYVMIILYS